MRLRRHVAVLPLLLLSACLTVAERQAAEMTSSLGAAKQQGDQCIERVRTDPRHQGILATLPLIDDVTLSHRRNHGVLSDSETLSLIGAYEELQMCRGLYIENYGRIDYRIVTLIADYYSRNDEQIARLADGQMSVSDFSNGIDRSRRQLDRDQIMLFNQIDEEFARSHQAELDDRARTVAALQRWSTAQTQILANDRLYDALRQPRYTSCSVGDYSVSCTTY